LYAGSGRVHYLGWLVLLYFALYLIMGNATPAAPSPEEER
jgi:hypothetical protein